MAIMGMGKGQREQYESEQRQRNRLKNLTGGDPYLTVVSGTIMRGKDTGMSYSRIESTQKKGDTFELNEERAKDARNWEYWYKQEYGNQAIPGTYTTWQGGKGGENVTRSKQARAIGQMKQRADQDGQMQYEIDQLRAETARIQAETKYQNRMRTPFQGNKAAMSLRAAQSAGRRSAGRSMGVRRSTYERGRTLG